MANGKLRIEYKNDESYFDDIINIIKKFDSFEYMKNEIITIIKSIDNNIKSIVMYESDDIYDELEINLYENKCYAINYDGKNYPIIAFYCNKITILEIDSVVKINDDSMWINLFDIELKSFDVVE